ncbi:MAG: primosomal protein N' [Alistipes sp.]|nr:primosomal protein N' [Alistipes sp.]
MSRFADIVLPLAQPAYCFSVPEGAEGDAVRVGDAVAVQFGPRNIYTGIVWRLHDERPDVKRIKPIGRRLYDLPLLDEKQMRLWEWMAEYYMCTIGEVMRMALPSLIKPQGRSDEEFSMEEFRPRTEGYVALAEAWRDEQKLKEELDRIRRRAPRRVEILEQIISFDKEKLNAEGEIPRRLLECDASHIMALRKAGYIVVNQRERSVERNENISFVTPSLTPAQQRVADEIRTSQREGRAVHLLRGITGSGKTEIYMNLISEVLACGGDVLLLVPEIALTAQLIERMERIFGSRVTSYHSKLTNLRRTETYLRLMNSQGGELVVGARSALFLPLRHLQLVIVDEEHDQSYKQSDTAPRYQGRDTAIVLASLYGGHTVLGSATPALESYANAQWGKYGYSYLGERYGAATPPRIIISDTIRSVKRGERRTHFNQVLINSIDEALERGEQAMLFQNRRGFSPFVQCNACGWTLRCPHCNVTLTMHRTADRMECHYCGHTTAVPHACPQCKTVDVKPMGFGTEKVEEAISTLFPSARVARLDRDTSTSESAYNRIIGTFESGQTDILVGTQMITKGFDFGRVSVVGILNADNLLYSPDFRSSERAFQLMTQVAGRAGRRQSEGVVIIQTSEPDNPVIGWVASGDYDAMARSELADRHAFSYPPYSRLLRLTLRDENVTLLRRGALALSDALREKFGRRVAGPVAPPIDKIRGQYIVCVMIKIENGRSMARARELLREAIAAFRADAEYKTITLSIDVDAQ